MSHEPLTTPPEFDEISNQEIAIPEWHKKILDELEAKYRPGDEDGWKTWEEFERELDEKLSRL